ncbi:zincin-like metallopeptidase domain-containing protein [Rhizobium sp. BK619]|uniref:zincin-like metallopeptidase domain-containing protein n=1 Tax=Rhizobium sp. BK619 TaxID=2586989 RepID=UPI0032B0F49B
MVDRQKKFGDTAYAKEELCAETGSAFLCSVGAFRPRATLQAARCYSTDALPISQGR